MSQKRQSKVYSLPADKFSILIKNSSSLVQVLLSLDLRTAGGNFKTLKSRIISEQLDISHFNLPENRTFIKSTIPLETVLVENSSYSRKSLRKRLIDNNLIEYKCSECNLESNWNGKKITLQLDHINGIHNDNRIENLRFLCPNCHSQTSTFSGRGCRRIKQLTYCLDCNKQISRNCVRCNSCNSKHLGTKINWPDISILKAMVEEHGYLGTGRILKVSDNAVRKKLKSWNLKN